MDERKPNGQQRQTAGNLRKLLGDQRDAAAVEHDHPEDGPERGDQHTGLRNPVQGRLSETISHLLARAEARDAEAERRDRAAEDRDKTGGSDPDDRRRQAALDRLHAARDRESAAADRAELLAVHRSYDTGQDSGSTGSRDVRRTSALPALAPHTLKKTQ